MTDTLRPLFSPLIESCLATCLIGLATLLFTAAPLASADSTQQLAPQADLLAGTSCLTELDLAAEWIGRDDGTARATLVELQSTCPDLPQVVHNLAVVAANEGDWDAAITYLQEALAMDARAAASVSALQSIYRWRAAEAYAQALDGTSDKAPPTLQAQNSLDINSDTRRFLQRDKTLFDASSVEYELWVWWRTASSDTDDEHRSHYTTDIDGDTDFIADTAQTLPDWNDLSRTIRFVDREAIALLSWTRSEQADNKEPMSSGRLLLLRLQEDRWRIHEELPLP